MENDVNEVYLTIPQAAKMMNVSRQTVYAWINKGQVNPIKTPGGSFRIPTRELVRPARRNREDTNNE